MLKGKTSDIIIAIVAALALWAFVTTQVNPTRQVTVEAVPVALMGLETLAADGLTVTVGSYAVDVVVKGPGSDVAQLTSGDFEATANMSNYPKGEVSVEVQITGPDLINILEVRPNKIQVTVEELVSANKPIKLSYSQKFPDGMEPGFVSVVPSEIEVSGTKTDVDSINYIKAEIDSSQLREEERTVSASVAPVDKAGDQVYGVSQSQNSVEVTATLCYVKEVPLDIEIKGHPPGALAVTKKDVPAKVSIRGSRDAIEGIDRVKADSISISNLRSTTVITPELELPEGVELAEASRDLAVTIEIGGEEAKSFEVTSDMIKVRGLTEGYYAHIVTSTLSVTIFGSHDQLTAFSPDDLKLYIDLSTVDPDEGKLQALVNSDNKNAFKRIDISPITVDVSIMALPSTNATAAPEIVTTEPAVGSDENKATGAE